MPRITGTFKATDGMPTEGTITAWSVDLRPAGKVAITSERRATRITQGQFTFDNLAPGPTRFTITGNHIAHDLVATIPDTATVDFIDLLTKVYTWEPEVISEAHRALTKAEQAATHAQSFRDQARTSAQDAREASEGVVGLREQAQTAARNAVSHAQQARGHADRAQQQADRAEGAATTARGAQSAADAAADRAASSTDQATQAAMRSEASATRATGEADRAGQEADRSEEAARRAVEGADRIGAAEAVSAAKKAAEAAASRSGSQADRSQREADRAEAAASTATSGISPQVRAEIEAKATKAEVDSALAGKASVRHQHRSADISDAVEGAQNERSRVVKTNKYGLFPLATTMILDQSSGAIASNNPNGIQQYGTPTSDHAVVNKKYVDAADEVLGRRIDTKVDASALEAKADKEQLGQLVTAVEAKAAVGHKHVSVDITDATTHLGSGSAARRSSVVRTDSSGEVNIGVARGLYVSHQDGIRINANQGSATNAKSAVNRGYVDAQVAKAAPVSHRHQVSDITGLGDEMISVVQRGVSSSKMAQASSGWATFYRVGNVVTIQVVNGGSATSVDIPAGFRPAVRPCYVPVTWLSDPVSVVLLNLDRRSGKAQIERVPGSGNAVHGTAVYMTTDTWPST